MHTTHTSRLLLLIHKCPYRARGLLVAVAMVSLGSCAILDWGLGPPPVEYRSVAVVIGDRGALHRSAGIHYEIANVADRGIAAFEIAFDLFDESSRAVPGAGRNSFLVVEVDRIEPGQSRRYAVSLDPIPEHLYDALLVSRFRVSRADFDDGSSWRNSGVYVYEEDGE